MGNRDAAAAKAVMAELRGCRPKGKTSFFEKLDPDARAKAMVMRALYREGRLTESRRTILAYFKTRLGAVVGQETLMTWMAQDDEEKS